MELPTRHLNPRLAALSLFAMLLTACSKDDTDDAAPPRKVTRWECILFGSYPANEVVSGISSLSLLSSSASRALLLNNSAILVAKVRIISQKQSFSWHY